MKTIAQDQKRTESLLQRRGIRLHDIQSFSFMKRFHEVPRKSNLKVKDKYGAGILTLRLKQGIQRAFYVHPFQKPSSVIRYLISQDIPFENHITRKRTVAEIPTTTYQRPSLYILLLCAFHHVHDIGISGCSIRKLVGIYSRNHFIRPEYLLYTHVDDTFLLSESR